MDVLIVRPGCGVNGSLRPPGDKSISHRALLFSGLARGRSLLRGLNPGGDCAHTRAALEGLGASFEATSEGLRVTGLGERTPPPSLAVDCGNSGTTLRVLAGALAGYPIDATYSGDASLSRRPVARVMEPLRRMGARVEAREDQLPPLRVRGGALQGIDYHSPVASAQVKSCVLLAGLRAQGESAVTEPALSRDHTERMLPAWGVPVEVAGLRCAVHGGSSLKGTDFEVPTDPSAALFWVVAALLVPGSDLTLEGVSLNPTRIGALEVLRRMGAELEVLQDPGGCEPRGTIRVRTSKLRAADITAPEVPSLVDELPVLAMAQAAAQGVSRVSGAQELRVKESDRVRTTVAMVRALGGSVEEHPDGWVVEGRAGAPFSPGMVEGEGDHRIIMSAAVAGLAASGEVRVRDIAAVVTSYPGFFGELRRWQT